MPTACTPSSGFVLIIGDGLSICEKTLQQALQQVGVSTQAVNDPTEAFSQLLDPLSAKTVRHRKLESSELESSELKSTGLPPDTQPLLIVLPEESADISGFEVCQQLKSSTHTRNIPVVLVGKGHGDSHGDGHDDSHEEGHNVGHSKAVLTPHYHRNKGLTAGAADYLASTLTPDEMALRIELRLQLSHLKTQLAEKNQDLEHAHSRLAEQEKLSTLGQLIAGVAHEINNPLGCIANNVEPASEYAQDMAKLIKLYQRHYPEPHTDISGLVKASDIEFALEDLPVLLSSMQLSADRIREISTALRNFARVDTTKKIRTNIHEGLDSTLVILAHRIKAMGDRAEIKIVKHYGDLPHIECFPSSLNQVFMNILANAMDALESTESPCITLHTRATGDDWVIVEISDNGPGLTSLIKQRLFEPLFTTKPIGKGTGLGLSISRQIIVDKHQGYIECISTPGEGCKFVLELPVNAAS